MYSYQACDVAIFLISRGLLRVVSGQTWQQDDTLEWRVSDKPSVSNNDILCAQTIKNLALLSHSYLQVSNCAGFSLMLATNKGYLKSSCSWLPVTITMKYTNVNVSIPIPILKHQICLMIQFSLGHVFSRMLCCIYYGFLAMIVRCQKLLL